MTTPEPRSRRVFAFYRPEALTANLARAERQRQSILKRVFEGRL